MAVSAYSHLKKWREKNPEAFKDHLRKYRKKNKVKIAEDLRQRRSGLKGPFSELDGPDWQKRNAERFVQMQNDNRIASRERIRSEAILHYGGKCFCCGETELVFLALDHVDGGGNQHRREIGGHTASWARRMGWPPIFRVACHNCNYAIYRNGGVCPHSCNVRQ